jgi:hypothetical protein
MKKLMIPIAAVLIVLPSLAFSDTFTFRVGYFFPKAGSDLWQTEFTNLTLDRADYQSTVFGVSYEHSFGPFLALEVAADTYSKMRSGFYRDWVGVNFDTETFAFPAADFGGDFSLIQSFSVSTLPIQLSLKVTPLGRKGSFIPYFGGGAALNIWSVKLLGDMVDFNDPYVATTPYGEFTVYPTYVADVRDTTRTAVSYQAFAGVMVPVGMRMTLDGSFKYFIGKGTLKDFSGFQPMDFDGFQITVGLNYWF